VRIFVHGEEKALIREKGAKPGLQRKKIGRNEKCPCGSGKKYKKCCLNKLNLDI